MLQTKYNWKNIFVKLTRALSPYSPAGVYYFLFSFFFNVIFFDFFSLYSFSFNFPFFFGFVCIFLVGCCISSVLEVGAGDGIVSVS